MSVHPTPWSVERSGWQDGYGHEGRIWDKDGEIVIWFEFDKKKSLDRIIHAVNCHDELLAVLKRYKQIQAGEETPRCNCCGEDETDGCADDCELNNTIQRAEGRE